MLTPEPPDKRFSSVEIRFPRSACCRRRLFERKRSLAAVRRVPDVLRIWDVVGCDSVWILRLKRVQVLLGKLRSGIDLVRKDEREIDVDGEIVGNLPEVATEGISLLGLEGPISTGVMTWRAAHSPL